MFAVTGGVHRVAMCITGLEVGGAETILAELLAHTPDDIKPKVFTLIDGGVIEERIRAMGIEVSGMHMRPGVPNLGAFFRMKRALREFAPDVVHTWMYHADLMGGVAARLIGTRRVIWHLHNSDLSPERTKRMTRVVVRICALLSRVVPSTIISCSQAGAGVHIARGYSAERMVVIPNGIDAERFAPASEARREVREEFALSDDVPLIGLVARFDPQKNHRGFFDAVRVFFARGGDAYFLLAGRGVTPDHWQLPGWAAETGRPERIVLAGPRQDVPRLMAAMDIATSSSLGEAFPLAVVEAMACAVPCVVTDVGDCRVMVGDSGLVVPPGDAESLARAWRTLVEMPAAERAELGRRARSRVLAHYTIEEFAERMWQLYRADR